MKRKLKFPGQKKGEEIQVLVRKHWIIDVKVAMMFLIFAIVPFAAALLGSMLYYEGGLPSNMKNFLLGLMIFWVYCLMALVMIYVKWLNEELDVIIVTNERILSHDQVDLFHREISETSIAQVQDVVGIEKGFFGHLFKYGTLRMQTAAQHIVFEIHNVSRPYETARNILDLRDKYLDKEKFESPSPLNHTNSQSTFKV